jgi:hypothetical protein
VVCLALRAVVAAAKPVEIHDENVEIVVRVAPGVALAAESVVRRSGRIRTSVPAGRVARVAGEVVFADE